MKKTLKEMIKEIKKGDWQEEYKLQLAEDYILLQNAEQEIEEFALHYDVQFVKTMKAIKKLKSDKKIAMDRFKMEEVK